MSESTRLRPQGTEAKEVPTDHGRRSGSGMNDHISSVLDRVAATIESRKGADPKSSYVASLFAKGEDAILKKIGEEATETVMAGKDGDKLRIASEVADLWFHCLILLAQHDLGPADVAAEFARREGVSGITEKASRGK